MTPDKAAACPSRSGQQAVHAPAPNVLWVSDFTYVPTWAGMVYVAFVIDVYSSALSAGASAARRRPASCPMRWSRPCTPAGQARASCIIATADRNTSDPLHRTAREAGIEPSVGSAGDSYDNALAESVIGLFKTEVTHRSGRGKPSRPWSTRPSTGSIGSTTSACWSRSARSRPPRRRLTTTRPLSHSNGRVGLEATRPPANPVRVHSGP